MSSLYGDVKLLERPPLAFVTSSRLTETGERPEPCKVLLFRIHNAKKLINVTVMHKICSPHARVLRIVIFKKDVLQAMVEFENIDAARTVKHSLDTMDIYPGCCTLDIVYAQPKLFVYRNSHNTWDYTVASDHSEPGVPKVQESRKHVYREVPRADSYDDPDSRSPSPLPSERKRPKEEPRRREGKGKSQTRYKPTPPPYSAESIQGDSPPAGYSLVDDCDILSRRRGSDRKSVSQTRYDIRDVLPAGSRRSRDSSTRKSRSVRSSRRSPYRVHSRSRSRYDVESRLPSSHPRRSRDEQHRYAKRNEGERRSRRAANREDLRRNGTPPSRSPDDRDPPPLPVALQHSRDHATSRSSPKNHKPSVPPPPFIRPSPTIIPAENYADWNPPTAVSHLSIPPPTVPPTVVRQPQTIIPADNYSDWNTPTVASIGRIAVEPVVAGLFPTEEMDDTRDVRTAVFMASGLDPRHANPTRLFNLICQYGNVMRINFLKSIEDCAMIEMADYESAARCVRFLNNLPLFGGELLVRRSKQHSVKGDLLGYMLPDNSPAFVDYSNSSLNRFNQSSLFKDHKFKPPFKFLQFRVKGIVADWQILLTFDHLSATVPQLRRPSRVVFFVNETPDVPCSEGSLEFNDLSEAVTALVYCNNVAISNTSKTSRFPPLLYLRFIGMDNQGRLD